MRMLSVEAEFHCHTSLSDGMASPESCVRIAARRNLQVLAITDHNTAEGGLSYWENPVRDGVLVIPGEEVSTERGHVLGFFLRASVAPGPFEKVVDEIHRQGGLAWMAHPYHIPLANRWRRRSIFQLTERQLGMLDGMEVENGHNRERANRMAGTLGGRRGMPATSGSDAHFTLEIGNARTFLHLPELSYEAVRSAMKSSGGLRSQRRRFNAYPLYLLVGLANRLAGRQYAYRQT